MSTLDNGPNNPIRSWTDARGKNPYQYLERDIPSDYDLEIRYATNYAQNTTTQGVNLVYPGTTNSHVIVRPKMDGVTVLGNSNNRYSQIPIIDLVELKLKSVHDSECNLISWITYLSKIFLGGRENTYTYPLDIYKDGNNRDAFTHDMIANEGLWIGNTSQAGIRPFLHAGANHAEE